MSDEPFTSYLRVSFGDTPPEQPTLQTEPASELSRLAWEWATRVLDDLGVRDDWSIDGYVEDSGTGNGPEGDVWSTVTLTLRHRTDGDTGCATLTGPDVDVAALQALTDQVQDAILEQAHGTPIPTCPGHPHPRVPTVSRGVLTWHCPREV